MPGLNRAQQQFYLENGYLIVEGVLDDGDLRQVREAMNETVEAIAGKLLAERKIPSLMADQPFEVRLALIFEAAGPGIAPRFGRSWRERKPGYFHLMSNPKILDIAETLIGPEIVAHPVYNTRPMVPGSPHVIVPWHQDCSYLDYKRVAMQEIPAFWIPLVDVTPDMGCLQVAPRTRQKGIVSYHRETYSGTGFLEVDEEHTKGIEIVTCDMKKGSVLLIDQMTFHRSTPNTTNRVRWSVDLRYQDARLPTGFEQQPALLVRSVTRPQAVATVDEFLSGRPERAA
ncbi:MAG: phytanoyl-CoA dioxygenase family protein [Planctomycetes bacterium]|nr:phytanoyl-CoA dioxygenase family protein [Planctomycetota bacterium]